MNEPLPLVEVVCALNADAAVSVQVALRPGMTVGEAIEAVRSSAQLNGIDLDRCPVGIFHKPTSRDRLVSAGDRIELYRLLTVDPKEARRRRVAHRTRQPGKC